MRNVVFQMKGRAMVNVQNCDGYREHWNMTLACFEERVMEVVLVYCWYKHEPQFVYHQSQYTCFIHCWLCLVLTMLPQRCLFACIVHLKSVLTPKYYLCFYFNRVLPWDGVKCHRGMMSRSGVVRNKPVSDWCIDVVILVHPILLINRILCSFANMLE
jgi:hypothetical protein